MTPEPCALLEWDSAHFGFPVARAATGELTAGGAEAIDRFCRERGVLCLYLLADPADAETTRVAAASGYMPVDQRLEVRHGLQGVDAATASGGIRCRDATARDLPQLLAIARRAHRTSRFYFDGRFPVKKVDSLYEAWVARGLADPIRAVRVAELDREPVGYQVLRLPDAKEGCALELLAVADSARGRGVGESLVRDGLQRLKDRGASSVPTSLPLRNIASIRVHERIGFLPEGAGVWHHKWYGEPAR